MVPLLALPPRVTLHLTFATLFASMLMHVTVIFRLLAENGDTIALEAGAVAREPAGQDDARRQGLVEAARQFRAVHAGAIGHDEHVHQLGTGQLPGQRLAGQVAFRRRLHVGGGAGDAGLLEGDGDGGELVVGHLRAGDLAGGGRGDHVGPGIGGADPGRELRILQQVAAAEKEDQLRRLSVEVAPAGLPTERGGVEALLDFHGRENYGRPERSLRESGTW